MDEWEQALATESKAQDPFTHLSKNTFVLGGCQHKYSDMDTPSGGLCFGEHFDQDGWSLWLSE